MTNPPELHQTGLEKAVNQSREKWYQEHGGRDTIQELVHRLEARLTAAEAVVKAYEEWRYVQDHIKEESVDEERFYDAEKGLNDCLTAYHIQAKGGSCDDLLAHFLCGY